MKSAAQTRDRFDAQRLGIAAFERLETFLSTDDGAAQHIHKYEQVPGQQFLVRHVADRRTCWLCVQLETVRAALDNAYERSLPAMIREADRG